MKTSLLTALAFCTSLLPLAAADESAWMTDFEAAKKKAVEEKKDLLLEFTGSDWCPPCMQLTKEVFSQESFTKGAAAKFVLVLLDFPRDESKLSADQKAQNEKLAEQYGIEGFPTVVLTDGRGRPYGQTGYQPGGPELYLTHLGELQGQRVDRDKALTAARKLEGVEKAKALQNAIAEFPDATVESFYSDVADEIEVSDPKDETGYKKARAYRRDVVAYESRVETLFGEEKFAEVMKEADKFLTDHQPTGLDKQHILMAKIIALVETGKQDEAMKELAAMKAVAPESELGMQADGLKERIEAFFSEQAGEAGEAGTRIGEPDAGDHADPDPAEHDHAEHAEGAETAEKK